MHQPVDTRRARLSAQREVCGGDVPVKNAARTLARKVSNGWRCDKSHSIKIGIEALGPK